MSSAGLVSSSIIERWSSIILRVEIDHNMSSKSQVCNYRCKSPLYCPTCGNDNCQASREMGGEALEAWWWRAVEAEEGEEQEQGQQEQEQEQELVCYNMCLRQRYMVGTEHEAHRCLTDSLWRT